MGEYIKREDAAMKINDAKRKTKSEDAWKMARDLGDAINAIPAANVVEIPSAGIGNLSDGYHTFNELYHHRAVLFSVICNANQERAWKSKKHDTGDMFDGMFIVGIETKDGQATYHYDVDPYWDMFHVKELPNAPKWDGHTPDMALNRIAAMAMDRFVQIEPGVIEE